MSILTTKYFNVDAQLSYISKRSKKADECREVDTIQWFGSFYEVEGWLYNQVQ